MTTLLLHFLNYIFHYFSSWISYCIKPTFFIFSFIKSAFLYNFAIKECDNTIVLK